MRYFSERLRTAQLMPDPVERDTVVFGSRATFARDDGRRQTFRILPSAESNRREVPVPRGSRGRDERDRASTTRR